MTFAEIRAAREVLGLTRAQLARLLETDPSSVARWETDTASNRTARKPPPRAVALLKAYLAGYRPAHWPGQG